MPCCLCHVGPYPQAVRVNPSSLKLLVIKVFFFFNHLVALLDHRTFKSNFVKGSWSTEPGWGQGDYTLERDIRTLALPLSLFASWLLKGDVLSCHEQGKQLTFDWSLWNHMPEQKLLVITCYSWVFCHSNWKVINKQENVSQAILHDKYCKKSSTCAQ